MAIAMAHRHMEKAQKMHASKVAMDREKLIEREQWQRLARAFLAWWLLAPSTRLHLHDSSTLHCCVPLPEMRSR
jgi:hypothetical protein